MTAIEGNRAIGAVAILVTRTNNYGNKIFRDNNNKVVKIQYIGRGGRKNQLQEDGKKKFVFVENQQLDKNYPLIFSCEKQLPVRVILQNEVGQYNEENNNNEKIENSEDENESLVEEKEEGESSEEENEDDETYGEENVNGDNDSDETEEDKNSNRKEYEYLGLFRINSFNYSTQLETNTGEKSQKRKQQDTNYKYVFELVRY